MKLLNIHRKKGKKRMSILLILCSFFTGCSNKRGLPQNVEGVFLHNQCTEYFYNLEDRYPTNALGTCGYTAASTLLMYYDYVYDDTLIDEKYEDRKKEPYGLYRADREVVEGMNAVDYYHFLEDTKDKYFQSYLITMANEKYHVYNEKSSLPGVLNNGSRSRIPEYYEETHAVIDYYLYEIKGVDEKKYKTYRIKDNIRDTVIKKVMSGIPVLMSVSFNHKDSHILICYDYDEENDELYANALWMENYNHLKLSSCYDTMTAPIVIEVVED